MVVIGLLDVFFTVLNYDGFSFLSSRLYRLTWAVVRRVTAPLPQGARDFGRFLCAPAMIPLTILFWMVLVILGFAMIYYAGLDQFSFSPGLAPDFAVAVYLSGVVTTTLGFGDVTPDTILYGTLVFFQALVGFSILTLVVSYVLNIYQVLQQWHTLASGLHHQASDSMDPLSALDAHFPGGEPRGLDSTVGGLHEDLVSYHEGLRRYPIVYYFHSRGIHRSLPFVFHVAGELAAALRWGLPGEHPAAREPQLPTLTTGIGDMIDQMEHSFLPSGPSGEAPEPAPFETFEAALRSEEAPDEHWLAEFLRVEGRMRGMAGLDAPDPAEAYGRYQAWLPFAHRVESFVDATADDLGYELSRFSVGEDGRQTSRENRGKPTGGSR